MSVRNWLCGLLPLAAILAGPAGAQSKEAERFGAREAVTGVRLSPDGTRYLALIARKGRGTHVIVADVAGREPLRAVLITDGDPERLTHCDWASATRLICGIYGIEGSGRDLLSFSRLFALDWDGGNRTLLTAQPRGEAWGVLQSGGQVIDWNGDEAGKSLLMRRQFVPDSVNENQRGFGVERVDPVTLRRAIVERPDPDAVEFITDGHGAVRVRGIRPQNGAGYGGTRTLYSYRKPASRQWEPLSVVSGDALARSGFDPVAVDRGLNVAYGFDRDRGRIALFKVALDGSGKRELVFGREDVDIDGVIYLGRARRVVGVTFATERRQRVFFDRDLAALQAALAKAIPKLPLIRLVDSSADEQKLLLWAGSDVNPGEYYVFDRRTRHLDRLSSVRPELEGVTLAEVKPITYAAADGTSILAYLTLPPKSAAKGLPAIVIPRGKLSTRDEWGFDWLAQFFASRGYAVLQPNFRESGGDGDAWFRNNGFRSWRTAVGDVNDAGRWLIAAGIADPTKLGIVGWTYGGYAALQSPVLAPDLFKAIVSIAPITDLDTFRNEFAQLQSFRLVDGFIGRGDHVKAGSPAQNVAAIRAPVLLFHGDKDRDVGVEESRMMASRLKDAGKPVELVEFKGVDHQIDDSVARTAMLDKADTFLRAAWKP